MFDRTVFSPIPIFSTNVPLTCVNCTVAIATGRRVCCSCFKYVAAVYRRLAGSNFAKMVLLCPNEKLRNKPVFTCRDLVDARTGGCDSCLKWYRQGVCVKPCDSIPSASVSCHRYTPNGHTSSSSVVFQQ